MTHQVQTSEALRLQRGEPLACYRRWQAARNPSTDGLLLVEFELSQYWLPRAPRVALTALYCSGGAGLRVAVTDRSLVSDGSAPSLQFDRWVFQYELAEFTPGRAIELLPTEVPKPWGREIWFSAVERRGVCEVGSGAARVPLPWLQAALPGAGTAAGKAPLLLKILDPSPQPVTGDLYFELHETKQEVYVVTRIDAGAWPRGVGYVRFGFSADKLASCRDARTFRSRYLAAVQAYEAIRRQLDMLPPGASPASEQLSLERRLRQEMDSFTHLRPVRVGDVIVVPPGLPHALQHGIRAVECQTPVYERKILSFAQRLRTQDHWDTAAVADHMLLTPPTDLPPLCLRQARGVRVECLADLPEFVVMRVRLESGASHDPGPLPACSLVMVLEGRLLLSGTCYNAEQAVLLPGGWHAALACPRGGQSLVLLLATPRRAVVEP